MFSTVLNVLDLGYVVGSTSSVRGRNSEPYETTPPPRGLINKSFPMEPPFDTGTGDLYKVVYSLVIPIPQVFPVDHTPESLNRRVILLHPPPTPRNVLGLRV